jgi:hypothetical protein
MVANLNHDAILLILTENWAFGCSAADSREQTVSSESQTLTSSDFGTSGFKAGKPRLGITFGTYFQPLVYLYRGFYISSNSRIPIRLG